MVRFLVLTLFPLAVIMLTPAVADLLVIARRRHWIICRQATWLYTAWMVLVIAGATFAWWASSTPDWWLIALLGFPAVTPIGVWLIRRHRHHEVDCVFGPRQPPDWSRVRLFRWRKVGIRPGFAAT